MKADDLMVQALSELSIAGPIHLPERALETLLGSYLRGPRTPLSDLAFEGNVLRRLKNLVATARLAPRPKSRPVTVIVGLPRTGSTLLHNLLAANPNVGFPAHWDVHHSWWRLTGEDANEARAEVNGRLDLMDAIGPGIRDSHPMQADWPEECTCVLENSFASFQWSITYGVPDYHRWLLDADLTEHYDLFRTAIDVLCPGNGPLVLKSPFHILHLDQLRRVFPGVHLIQTVRSTSEVMGSWLRFVTTTQDAIFAGERPLSTQPLWVETLDRMASVAVDTEPETVVRYDELNADPCGVLDSVLLATGTALTSEHEEAARAWITSAEAGRRATGTVPTFTGTAAMDAYDRCFDL